MPLLNRVTLSLFAVLLLQAVPVRAGGAAEEAKMEAILVWATNESESPDPKHKRLEPELQKHFKIYKWKSYFVINRETTGLKEDKPEEVEVSKHCKVTMKYLGDNRFYIRLIGEGKEVIEGTHSMKKGEGMALGGDSENDSSWWVLFHRKQ